jgi:hypothetical protein
MKEKSQMSQKQLAEILGNKGNVSKVLNMPKASLCEKKETITGNDKKAE